MTPDELNDLIQNCIDLLVAERWREGIQAMDELIHIHKFAGMEHVLTMLCEEIWEEATARTENMMFTERFVEEMKLYREEKQGRIVVH